MSDTSEAAVRQLREDSPTVDTVCRQIERHVEPADAERAIPFTEIFFSKAPQEFTRGRSTDALAHIALGAFDFLQESRPNRVDVQVLNPDVDNEGWYAPVTVIRTNISERPFIIDTLREFLSSHDLAIEHLIYPVLHVERDPDGGVLAIRTSQEGEKRESLVHCEISRVQDAAELDTIRSGLASRLQDVVRVTDDFQPMVTQVDEVVAQLEDASTIVPDRKAELQEVQAFLEWLRDGAFVFLGYRGYDLTIEPESEKRCVVVEPGSGLGVLRNEAESRFREPVLLESMEDGFRRRVESGPLLIISKTNAESTVHRRARMDYIGVKKLDQHGEIVGEHRFMGLFTSKAYSEVAEDIPILREKLRKIIESAGAQEGTHDFKEINTIFNSMPKEELFLASVEEIGADVQTVLTTYHSDDVRVTLREDLLERGAAVMIILPKEKFSGDVRRGIEEVLVEVLGGEVLNYHLALGEGDQARLHFYLAVPPGRLESVSPDDLEAAIHGLIRTWDDRVREGLERLKPVEDARRLARRYGSAFRGKYKAAHTPEVAVRDIIELEGMSADGREVSIALADRSDGDDGVTELKLYLRGQRLVLSDFMPILENAGLRVISVSPFDVRAEGMVPANVYAFAVQDHEGERLPVDEVGRLLATAILAVRSGDATNDGLNALVVGAKLHWREVDVLRAYAQYAFQLGAIPARVALTSALVRYPSIARSLLGLFVAKFDPSGPEDFGERKVRVSTLHRSVQSELGSVALLADDRALRAMLTLIDATTRTNYFATGARKPTRRSGGAPYLSFKVNARELQSIARSRLLYEVWVRSSRMEGVHLRGATVSRGGIRWSDRPDDFRTEVLGLVNTQLVKNAVIVPAGSKGGFIPLRPPEDREAWLEDGKEQYRTLIRGLLDVTDNLDPEGNILHPENVVRWDADDPYLVVAADKGTAKFSDVANAIATEYGFWLGDAFASGGSNGYDHKAVGITAGGGWECVKRHFRERGKDIQAEPFTVVGIGDMSGDVFGNGMLLSRQIRLVAAFDHRHIFIDPDPDPETSYQERERMFGLGRSTWEDYDASLLSAGGVVIPRGAKSVELTPEARKALGVEEDVGELDGEALVRVVLKAPVELLWNGGIGTYVKATSETHADAGDPTNDAVRINACELRCDVVGEGGNLGFTQLGRIEYALGGGRINTDALDNSGGVDLSDREVNLKILLNPSVRSGAMSEEDRNTLLEELTDSVASLVLADNRSQSLAVSLDQARAEESVDDFRGLMTSLEKAGALDRAAERLPTFEQLQERQEAGATLTRPELSVLLAYAKLNLMSALLRSDLPDDPVTRNYLVDYFPAGAVATVGQDRLVEHRLHREIIASQVTNDLVDAMGASFLHRVKRDSGYEIADIARAWLIAACIAGHRSLLGLVADQRDAVGAAVTYRWLLGLGRVLERTTRWLLPYLRSIESTVDFIEESLPGLVLLREHFGEIVTGPERDIYERRIREMRQVGADDDFGLRLIPLRFLDQLLKILRVAKSTDSDVLETGRAFYRISDSLSIPWLRIAVFDAAGDDRWEQRAAQSLAADLARAHHRILVEIMSRGTEGDTGSTTEAVFATRGAEVGRFRELLEELKAEESLTLSGLSVGVREVLLLAEQLSSES